MYIHVYAHTPLICVMYVYIHSEVVCVRNGTFVEYIHIKVVCVRNVYTLRPPEKLLGVGFSTSMPLFCLICTIISNKPCILD